jgi:plastocyanin
MRCTPFDGVETGIPAASAVASRPSTTRLLAPFALLAALACAQRPAEAPATDANRPAGSARQLTPTAAAAAEAEGEVAAGVVVTGTAAPASGGFPAVVTLEPSLGGGEAGRGAAVTTSEALDAGGDPDHAIVTPPPVFMDQVTGAFYPPTLLVRAGQTVEFLNSESVMHNVSVASDATGATVFNIATPPGFESYPHVFDAPGVYRVKCDIHPSMSAFIVGVATPYAAVADRDGRFTIRDVPPGSYRASVWSLEVSRRVTRSLEIPPASATIDLDLRSAE